MNITKESNYSAEKEVVQTFMDGLGTIEKKFNGTIKDEHSTITSLTFNSWTDIVGQTIKGRTAYLKDNDFKVIETDFEGGSFQKLKTNTSSLLNELQVCINSKAKIDAINAKIAELPAQVVVGTKEVWDNPDWRPSYQGGTGGTSSKHTENVYGKNPEITKLEGERSEREAELDNGIKYANTYIKEYANIHFLGTHGNNKPQTQEQAVVEEVVEEEPFDEEAAYIKFSEELAAMELNQKMIVYDSDGVEYVIIKVADGELKVDVNDGSGKCIGILSGYQILDDFTQYNPNPSSDD